MKRFGEEELIFLINLSEHVKRPEDMLMFLGEYFKEVIRQNMKIKTSLESGSAEKGAQKKQSEFYLTVDVINYLATACKNYVENPRHELRLSIALSRNPTFHGPPRTKD